MKLICLKLETSLTRFNIFCLFLHPHPHSPPSTTPPPPLLPPPLHHHSTTTSSSTTNTTASSHAHDLWLQQHHLRLLAIHDTHGDRFRLHKLDIALDAGALFRAYSEAYASEDKQTQHRCSVQFDGNNYNKGKHTWEPKMDIEVYDLFLSNHHEILDRPTPWWYARYLLSPTDDTVDFEREMKRLQLRVAGLAKRSREDDTVDTDGIGNGTRRDIGGCLSGIISHQLLQQSVTRATDGGYRLDMKGKAMNGRKATVVLGRPHGQLDDLGNATVCGGYVLHSTWNRAVFISGEGQCRKDEELLVALSMLVLLYTGEYPIDPITTIIAFWGLDPAFSYHTDNFKMLFNCGTMVRIVLSRCNMVLFCCLPRHCSCSHTGWFFV